jgi:hypothetical protein
VGSSEALVKAPLGILWFGGPSNESVLPRHGHGPSPQVAGGRTIIQGRNMIRAVDVYTGQLLWERNITDVGKYYDYTSHEPGASAIGSNYVSLEDSIYVIQGETCYRLDAATGETLGEFKAPSAAGEEGNPEWGYLSVVGDVLVGGVQPVQFKTHAFQFRELRKYDGDKGRKLQTEIRNWKNFEAYEPKGNGPEPTALVENLNRLLFSKDFLAKIPTDVRESSCHGARKQAHGILVWRNDRELEPTAIEIKRRLLQEVLRLTRLRRRRHRHVYEFEPTFEPAIGRPQSTYGRSSLECGSPVLVPPQRDCGWKQQSLRTRSFAGCRSGTSATPGPAE